ncbi:cation channel sperm-associated auxiliary subunit epsilon isoform X8 [Homo sapiens]|uniref:cation channel sperm-associated auxiliary subunit epsilon isoform X8 n=1 Tax=Homo sapiens TaxID=9606 RepID=UPI0007DC7528|nr:cation channel sperm-associated auxiliary subunit epsilon isoform X8 [Homo sapiens]XP_047273073.1 cation channel sperm-associated auxiliary subunit epsilon isoform X8 [Homo sapiens]XP_054191800.1 cation channel sperm-associated auxiliary subunit epsilon isoform X8 [Homo sapiens]XP_054191801.1 cation channel sperm-associated auxiliary subunit epsilon isoform X8 [Homo sapiens]XP_054191802.1 cation channel sperm-associated auxiliary subunit epsilon isoform X8 [Homo sapiens]|eukprot:XP_016856440.1 cation channel sperm-associated protein subunit epsilon isoform X8 [Homo sapiens]
MQRSGLRRCILGPLCLPSAGEKKEEREKRQIQLASCYLHWIFFGKIKLEYEGTLFTEWSVPETCFVLNKSSPTTELRCSSPGVHAIKPIVTGPDEEERYLFVESSHTCFLWYYRVRHFFNNFTQLITVWAYDPESADPDELLGNAEEPSINSIVLSTQMATLGQKPVIHTVLKRKVYSSNEKMRRGTWRIVVPMTKDDALKEIRGNQVTFQDCFIADFLILLTFPLLTIPEIPGYLPISSPRGSQLMASWDACVVASAVLVTDMETFHTTDSFKSWTRIRVPPDILSDDERRSVAHVILSRDGIVFLINGVLYIKSFRGFIRLGGIVNLPDGGITGISSRKWCWVNYLLKAKGRRSTFAVWTENEIYLGSILLKFARLVTTTELKNILSLSVTATLTIDRVEYTGHPLEIAVFLNYCTVCNVTKKIFLVIYNEDTKQWVSQDFTLDAPIDSVTMPHFTFSALPGLLLWNKHSIYYCYHNFTFTGILQTPAGHGNLSMLSNDSIIHEVFIDYYGDILVKMENNVIFYSKINTRDAVKLHLWTNYTTRAFIFLSTSGQTYFLYALDDGTIQIQDYPLHLEAQSIAFTTKDKCPYMAFHNNVAHVFYFLDKGEALTVWTQIVYPENTGLYVIVESYGPKILQESHEISFEAAFGYCTKTLTLTFYQNVDYERISDYFETQDKHTGLVLVQFRPSEYSKACPIAQKVFQIAVGCDDKKFIAIKGFSKKGCHHHDFSYVIEKSYLRHQPSKNLRVRYIWGEYGCPLRLDFTEKFQPVVQLVVVYMKHRHGSQ